MAVNFTRAANAANISRSRENPLADAAATQFFSKTYDETHALLVAARDYLAHADPASSPGL